MRKNHQTIGHCCLLMIVTTMFYTKMAQGIECYRCISTNSSQPFLCNEFLTDLTIEPQSCDDVYDAKYCIKHVGRFEVGALDCYQCTSANEWMCENSHLVYKYLKPKSCDHVFDAQYCIRTIGRYGGGIGTKRFCSSKNLGNYCNDVHQPGDKLIYRTCIYTCDSDGCNPASTAMSPPSKLTNIIQLSGIFVIFKFILQI